MADPTSHAGTLGPPQDYLVRDYAPVDTIRREYLQQLSDKSHFVGCDVLGYVMAGNRAIANLAPAISLADRVYVYDNSIDGVDARLCARTQDGLLRKVYGPLPRWVADSVLRLDRHPEFLDSRAA